MRLNNTVLLIFFFLFTNSLYGQQNFEQRTYIEINERADFYEVNNRYQVANDTIFFSFSGFLINAEYDNHKIGEIEYIVLTYPDFVGGKQPLKPPAMIEIKKSPSDLKSDGIRKSINRINGKILIIEKERFEKLDKNTLYDTNFRKIKNYKFTTGLLTIPFKYRPSQDSLNFKMTTDVTLGPYLGVTKRISKRNTYYMTIPATLGLSFINLNNNVTSTQQSNDIDLIPGFSMSTGLIFQFDNFTIGYVIGLDYASGIGKDWIYQGKEWHSFAIGYSFIKSDGK